MTVAAPIPLTLPPLARAADDPADDPVDFLAAVFGTETFGHAVLAFKDAAGAFHHKGVRLDRPDRWDVARVHIEKFARTCDVYVAVAMYIDAYRRGPNGWEWRTRPMVGHCRWVILDRDDHGLGPNVPEPSFMVETSAGRWQDWWLLDRPVAAAVGDDLNRRVAAACGCGMQAVAVTTVLRLPGTTNRKPGRATATVGVVRATRLAYSPDDFAHLPAPTTGQPLSSPPAGTRTSSTRSGSGVRRSDTRVDDARHVEMPVPNFRGVELFDQIAPLLSLRMMAAAGGEAVAKADGKPYASESNRDMALMVAIVGAGLDGEIAMAAFMATTRGAMLAVRKPSGLRARLQRMVTKARAYTEAHPFALPPSDSPLVALPRSVVDDAARIGANGLAVAGVIASFAPNPYPAQGNIGRLLDLSARTVGEAVATLRDSGNVRTKRRYNATSRYTLPGDETEVVRFPRVVLRADEPLGAHAVALAILLAAHEHPPSPTVGEAAVTLGIAKPQARRASRTLARAGLATLHGDDTTTTRPSREVIGKPVPSTSFEGDEANDEGCDNRRIW